MEYYIHIPFCVRKCRYCDFLSAPPADPAAQERCVDALLREIRASAGKEKVTSVFFGGGTPSILPAPAIPRILGEIRKTRSLSPDAEITIEANPDTVTPEKLAAWQEAGANRLSLGLQSACDAELEMLGRIHTFGRFLRVYRDARDAGFANVNVDLMSALPGQTLSRWEDTLRTCAELEPEHISAYSLIVEEGTPFFQDYGENAKDLRTYGEYGAMPAEMRERYEKAARAGRALLPGETDERAMYRRTAEILAAYGYERYEISNYAKPGYASRHNLGYWTGADYLGFGPGASSLCRGERFHNTDNLAEYLAETPADFAAGRQRREITRLSEKDRMEEFMFLGVRLIRGISAETFRKTFGREITEIYGEPLRKAMAGGLMEKRETEEGETLYRLTERGLDLSNLVEETFLLD